MISNQCFTNDQLKTIAEFIYVGAETTGNGLLKRPIPQLSLKDIPQKRFEDFSEVIAFRLRLVVAPSVGSPERIHLRYPVLLDRKL